MVRVQGHGRRALGSVDVADHRWATALDDDLHVEALASKQLGHGLGAARDVGLVEAGRRDAGDTDERLEVGLHLGHELSDSVTDGLDLVRGEHVVSHRQTLSRWHRGGGPGARLIPRIRWFGASAPRYGHHHG